MDISRNTVHIPTWILWFKARWYAVLRTSHPGHPFSDGDLSTVFDHRHAVCMAWFNCLVASYAPIPLPAQVELCRGFERATDNCALDPTVQHFDYYFQCCIVHHARSGALALFEQQLAAGEVPHLAEELLEQHLAQGLGDTVLSGGEQGFDFGAIGELGQGLYDMPIDEHGQVISLPIRERAHPQDVETVVSVREQEPDHMDVSEREPEQGRAPDA